VKLLRVLQEREFEPLGAERTQRVDVRVVAATNRDLKQMVSDGRFQEDLYYRLNVIPIEIPPLRDRRDDIPTLVDHFVEKHRQRSGKRVDGVDPGVTEALGRYDWPGNVRELENVLERAATLCSGGIIDAGDLQLRPKVANTEVPIPNTVAPGEKLGDALEDIERDAIVRALEQTRYNKTKAAQLLGMTFRSLRYRIKKLGIE
jgi:two-component system response regulator PilR (NtrC family)